MRGGTFSGPTYGDFETAAPRRERVIGCAVRFGVLDVGCEVDWLGVGFVEL